MAHHLLTTTTLPDGQQPMIDGGQTLPEATYCGFAIGSQADHDQLIVEAGQTVLVCAGAVTPIEPWRGVPKVSAPRRLFADAGALAYLASRPVLHLLGLTSQCELAIRPRRARRAWIYSWTDEDVELYVPIGGRRHVLLAGTFASAVTVTVYGFSLEAAESYDATTPARKQLYTAAGLTELAVNFGGTDHEELYENLAIHVGNAGGAKRLRVYAAGEVGG